MLVIHGKSLTSMLLNCGAYIQKRGDSYSASFPFYARCCKGRWDFDVDPFCTRNPIRRELRNVTLQVLLYGDSNDILGKPS